MSDLLNRTVDFEGNRKAGLQRLRDFVPFAASRYTQTRNHDLGPQDRSNVSALSPWVRHRLVTEEELAAAVLGQFALSSAEKFIQEVFWRTYWKGWLELRPTVFSDYEAERDKTYAEMNENATLRKAVDRALGANTGIDCFDFWVRELVETGYLHNHARMWFASIWIFTLRLPWALGADFFYRHLMDGDPASNTLSWRWVAGLQTQGKNYVARASNIAKFTDGRFDPKGLDENATPLSGAPHPPAMTLPPADRMPDGQSVFLLFNEDECRADEIRFGTNRVVGAASWNLTATRSPEPIGEKASAFARDALADARMRFAEAHALEDIHAFEFGWERDADEEISAIVQAVAISKAQAIIIPWVPVSSAARIMHRAEKALRDQGVAIHRIRRAHDERTWPHATKGFFPFREKIPDFLRDAGFDIKAKMGRHA